MSLTASRDHRAQRPRQRLGRRAWPAIEFLRCCARDEWPASTERSAAGIHEATGWLGPSPVLFLEVAKVRFVLMADLSLERSKGRLPPRLAAANLSDFALLARSLRKVFRAAMSVSPCCLRPSATRVRRCLIYQMEDRDILELSCLSFRTA